MKSIERNRWFVNKANAFREELLHNATRAEKIVLSKLLKSEYAPYVQFQFPLYITWEDSWNIKKFYIVDFFILSLNTVIEVDGGYHDTPEQRKKDKIKTRELRKEGYNVIRIRNEQVYQDPMCRFLFSLLSRVRP